MEISCSAFIKTDRTFTKKYFMLEIIISDIKYIMNNASEFLKFISTQISHKSLNFEWKYQ